MSAKMGKYILHGLEHHEKVIKEIIKELDLINYYLFDIKLLLTEALVNAFKHGNQGDASKPIYLNYTFDGMKIIFYVKDSGFVKHNIGIPDEISDESILDENGRGLFLIKCLADEVKFLDNTLIIEKSLTHAI